MARPLKFETPEILQKEIDAYFESCFKVGELVVGKGKNKKVINQRFQFRPFTITGLALALDTTRDTLLDYETKYGDEFSDAIKKAKLKCQNYAEEALFGNNVTGVIFNLKNNYAWKDRTEQDITSGGERLAGFEYVKPNRKETTDRADS